MPVEQQDYEMIDNGFVNTVLGTSLWKLMI